MRITRSKCAAGNEHYGLRHPPAAGDKRRGPLSSASGFRARVAQLRTGRLGRAGAALRVSLVLLLASRTNRARPCRPHGARWLPRGDLCGVHTRSPTPLGRPHAAPVPGAAGLRARSTGASACAPRARAKSTAGCSPPPPCSALRAAAGCPAPVTHAAPRPWASVSHAAPWRAPHTDAQGPRARRAPGGERRG